MDDEEIFNYLNAEVIQLTSKTYRHQAFSSGADALDYLKASIEGGGPAMPDVILLDIRMPKMNGFEFLDELMKCDARRIRETSVYVLSSSLDQRDIKRALAYPVVRGFRSKPLSEEMVMEIISELPASDGPKEDDSVAPKN